VCIVKGNVKEAVSTREDLAFGFFLASSSVEPHISICAYQLWFVTRNVHILNSIYELNRYVCLAT